MPPSPPRRLNLLDGMILVAGVAAGIASFQYYRRGSYPQFFERYGRFGFQPQRLSAYFEEFNPLLSNLLAVMAVVLLSMRLRQPRPRLWDVFRRPGAVASLAGSITAAVGGTLWLGLVVFARLGDDASIDDFGKPIGYRLYEATLLRTLIPTGLVVAVAWICLSLNGRRRPGRDALDRAGLVLGWGFIVLTATTAFSQTFSEAQHALFKVRMVKVDGPRYQQQQFDESVASIKEARESNHALTARLKELIRSNDPAAIRAYFEETLRSVEDSDKAWDKYEAENVGNQTPPALPTPSGP